MSLEMEMKHHPRCPGDAAVTCEAISSALFQKYSSKASVLSLGLARLTRVLCAAAMIMVFAIAGCGSDNSSSPSPKSTATASPTPSPTPTPAINAALWVATRQGILEYIPSQLAVQGVSTPVPARTFVGHAIGSPNGLAFDAAGNLWVAMGTSVTGGGEIVPASLSEFTAAAFLGYVAGPDGTIEISGHIAGPNAMIQFTGFTNPAQLVFDTKGDLWLSDSGSNAVFEYTAAQLAAASKVTIEMTPNIVITSSPAFAGPVGIALDAAGDLWIANNGSTTISEFNAASLPTAAGSVVTLTPDVILSDDGNGSIQAPWGLVFDSAGNLWSSNSATPFTLVEFAQSVLGTSGSPVPVVTINPADVAGDPSLIAPAGVAFDNLGDLAAGNLSSPFGISLFSKAQIGASGAPVPDVFITNIPGSTPPTAGIVFGPAYLN
jgi:hypothetical protein